MLWRLSCTLLLLLLSTAVSAESKLTFRLSFPPGVQSEPITGRAYVIISRTNEKEPRLQVGRTGAPFFGRDFDSIGPGETIEIDASDLGSPVASLSEIPAGEYFVQGFINIYTEFARADGHTVWMPNDHWDGQQWERSPGNLHSVSARLTLDPDAGYEHELAIDQVIPDIPLPPDTR